MKQKDTLREKEREGGHLPQICQSVSFVDFLCFPPRSRKKRQEAQDKRGRGDPIAWEGCHVTDVIACGEFAFFFFFVLFFSLSLFLALFLLFAFATLANVKIFQC